MKNNNFIYASLVFLLLAESSCSKEEPQDENIRINESNIEINYGETYPIQAEFNREGYNRSEFTWSSSHENIARVNQQGVVSGERAGVSTITVKTIDELFNANTSVTVIPTNMMFLEPLLDFRQSRDFIRENETREFIQESDEVLYFDGENEEVDFIAYWFNQDLYEESIVVFDTTEENIEKAADFLVQRYDLAGVDENNVYYFNEGNLYILFMLYPGLGLTMIYLEDDGTSASARIGRVMERMKNFKPLKPYSGKHQIDPRKFK